MDRVRFEAINPTFLLAVTKNDGGRRLTRTRVESDGAANDDSRTVSMRLTLHWPSGCGDPRLRQRYYS